MTLMQATLPPLSLYIHVPWCVRKCPYCDFNSHEAKDELPQAQYITALLKDLDEELAYVAGRPIQSIFIGGGTPSLFDAPAYARLFSELKKNLNFAPDIEITLEANPGTFEANKFAAYRETGINRLSMGIQSFNDLQLQALGRIHDSDQAKKAIDIAHTVGFDNFNLDLMHGLPGQSLRDALDDIKQALTFNPKHLSWYQLTIEPNTEYYSKPPTLPQDETLWDIQEQGQALLASAGLAQYEISAYSQPGQQARHNLNYWQFGDYIGIGAGAHGKLTLSNGTIIRRNKTRAPKDYLNPDKPFCAGEKAIPQEEMGLEFMMNALRLSQGVASDLFPRYTGQSLASIQPQMDEAIKQGLLINDPKRIAPTEKGRLYLNDLLGVFL
jgi:oxygen-independent coproporphyrinogen-3 oxidase